MESSTGTACGLGGGFESSSLAGMCQSAGGQLADSFHPCLYPLARPAAATLGSFVVALAFFVSELLVYKTVSLKGALSPMIVASKWRACL